MKIKNFFKSKWGSALLLAAVMAAVVFFPYWRLRNNGAGFIPRDGRLHARFFDVGQGDAALIVMPDGSDILIDGGPDKRILEQLGRSLPPSNRKIELLILTHPHLDHFFGLIEVLNRYKVDKILMTDAAASGSAYGEWRRLAGREGAEIVEAKSGESYSFGGAKLMILYPEKDYTGVRISEEGENEGGGINGTSIVSRVIYGENEILFMGDASSAIEKEIISRRGEYQSDILKVGHHGSKYSTAPEFIAAVAPENAIISSGAGNRYGHPHYRVLRALDRAGVKTWRTDTDGSITAIGDGKSWELFAENTVQSSCQDKNKVIQWFLRCN